ncbi:alpha/beta hydrolase family protein [Phenylobacterium immobile]|uniref:alpha/beta hydrolase family protein n=1 Tax=Phenylobacterium immobile TaxID=21 RepID=UPI000A6C186F|nr:prolyl oligopeptidase family serine peptidase [Phenylobacterium immobile]
MRPTLRALSFAALILAASDSAAQTATVAPTPAAAFGRIPQVQQATISPDGAKIAVLGGAGDQRAITLATIDQPGLPTLALGETEALSIRWAGENLLIQVVIPFTRPGQPRDRYRLERWLSVNSQGQVVADMLDNHPASELFLGRPLVDVTETTPVRALMLGAAGSPDQFGHLRRGLWSVDVKSGHGRLVDSGSRSTYNWEIDAAGAPRVRLDYGYVYVRKDGQTIWSIALDQARDPALSYLGYVEGPPSVILGSKRDGAYRILRRDITTGAEQTLWEGASPATPLWSPSHRAMAGVSTLVDGRATPQWFDKEVGEVHRSLSAAVAPTRVNLVDWSADRSRFIARIQAADGPGGWFLFDRAAKALSPLGLEYPELQGVRLGETRALSLAMPGGRYAEAYLTLPPPGARLGKPPLIVIPHLGALSEAEASFDYLSAFLASRGMAVLRVRLSIPTLTPVDGKSMVEKVFIRLENDLVVAVDQAALLADVDAGSTCVIGRAESGYFALLTATLHSDRYRCVATVGAWTDLGLVRAGQVRLFGDRYMPYLLDRLSDAPKDEIERISPLKRAAAFKAPALLIHTQEDTVIPVVHARQMAAALSAAHRPVELVLLPGDDHSLLSSTNRTKMLTTLEAFLAKNLPAAPQ